MRSKADEHLLAALQQTVSVAIQQWLAENKGEVLQMIREAMLESETAKHQRQQQQTKVNELLTVVEVAKRWQLHPESVRRMIRQGRIPAVKIGPQNRVALITLEKFEHDGAVPDCPLGVQ
jgi:excisionase family DNA binding protein